MAKLVAKSGEELEEPRTVNSEIAKQCNADSLEIRCYHIHSTFCPLKINFSHLDQSSRPGRTEKRNQKGNIYQTGVFYGPYG